MEAKVSLIHDMLSTMILARARTHFKIDHPLRFLPQLILQQNYKKNTIQHFLRK